MSREAVQQIARLGVVVDMQPAWLYLDTRTLMKQFGDERLRWFQPLHSLFDAGVIIHESQLTYREEGLTKVMDFGELWQERDQLLVCAPEARVQVPAEHIVEGRQ